MWGVGALMLAGVVTLFLLRSRGPTDTTPLTLLASNSSAPDSKEHVGVAPVDEEITTRKPAVDPSPAAPVAEKPAPAAWKAVRLKQLDQTWSELEDAIKKGADPRSSAGEFLMITSAPILDELGMYEIPQKGVKHDLKATKDTNVFTFRDRVYKFDRGLLPAYDGFADSWNTFEKTQKDSPKTAEDFKFEPMKIDPFLEAQFEELREQARAAILRRSEPY